MSISFTNGTPASKPVPMDAPSSPKGKKPDEKKPPPAIQRLERQQKQLGDKLERAKKQMGLAKKVASAFASQDIPKESWARPALPPRVSLVARVADEFSLETAKSACMPVAPKKAPAFARAVLAEGMNPNDDPNEIFEQARPILSKMNLANDADKGKTELVLGKTRGADSYYKVVLRRNAVIDADKIDRIKRNMKNFDMIEWTATSMCVYIWWPYKAAEEAGAGAPAGGI